MSFVNRQVDVATLPRFDAVRLEKPSPAYRRLVSIIVGLVAAPVLIAAILFAAAAHGVTLPVRLLVLLLVVAVLAGVAAIVHAHVRCIGYAVREHDVILRSGIFFKAESVQPLKRIQHVEQVQGPLDKRFGLWTLKLYSAGTGRATFSIPGLEADTANAIRRFVLSFHEPAAPAASPPETSVPADG